MNNNAKPTDTVEALRDHTACDRPASLPAAVEPLLLTREQLAELLNIGVATLDRLRDSGRIPPPLRLSAGLVRWSLTEMRAWIAAGAPPAKEWTALRTAQASGRRL